MVYLTAEDLEEVAYKALRAVGAPDRHARIVAAHLVENNVIGHHSHGILRLLVYTENVRQGRTVPDAEPSVVNESDTTVLIDGGWTFGQVVADFATDIVISKAKDHGMSCASMRDLGHIGRLGYYAEKMTREGLASILFAASGGYVVGMAPFGGKERRMGTNPIAIGFPFEPDGPFLADIATSAVADGKLRLARARGERVKEGLIIDPDGNPSTNPEDYFNGGALLPMGGSEAHKGYALAFMVDLFASVLSQGTFPGRPPKAYSNTSFFIGIDVTRFAPLDKLKEDTTTMVDFLKDTSLIDETKPILYPGELEAGARKKGRKSRISLEESTWNSIEELLRGYSLDDFVDTLDIKKHE